MGHCSTPGGGHVAPSRAEALTGAPPPPGRLARSRRSAVPAVTLCRWSRLQRPGLARPSVLGIFSPHKVTVKGAPSGRVAKAMAQSATLECDLSRQVHRHLSEGRGKLRQSSSDPR